jgi:T5SS/PEP-CTERM-associated repeat protein
VFGNEGIGIYNNGGGVHAYNSAITHNHSAGDAGGYGTGSGYNSLLNCTVAHNRAEGQGGACHLNLSDVQFQNCIFFGNYAAGGANLFRGSACSGSVNDCLLGGDIIWNTGSPGSNQPSFFANIGGDPLFVAPGGPAGLPGTSADSFRLGPLSPCIDTANPAYNAGLTDLDGHRRVFDGDANGVATVDYGAYEYGSPIYSPVVYVRSTASGANNGSSWADAFSGALGLQSALSFVSGQPAGAYTDVWVAAGTYKPAGFNGSRSATFQLQNNLAIYGGFAGTETQLSQRNIAANPTILSGDLNGDDSGTFNREDNSYHVVTASGATGAVLDGFTIRAGTATGAAANDQIGAGIVATSGSLALSNCTVESNISTGYAPVGGGVGTGGGGGMYVQSATATVRNCSFLSNAITTPATDYAPGGAALCATTGSAVRVYDSLFAANTAPGGYYFGGAVAAWGNAQLAVVHSTFLQNMSACPGAAIGAAPNYANVSVSVINCSFLGNRCSAGGTPSWSVGGAIGHMGSGLLLVGSQFVGNQSECGGAVFTNRAATIINSTFVSNQSSDCAGGLHLGDGSVSNCVIWNNTVPGNPTAPEVFFWYQGGAITYTSRSDYTGQPGAGNNGANPQFLRLPSPGPDGVWGTADDDYGNLHLGPGSGAIDSGDGTVVPFDTYDLNGNGVTTEVLPYDLDKNPRFVDDPNTTNTGVGDPPVDRGAYENNLSTAVWTSPSGGSWTIAGNWQGGVFPSANTRAYFDSRVGTTQTAYTVTVPSDQTAYSLAVLANGVTMNLRGGSSNGNVTLYAPAADPNPALLVGDTAGLATGLTVTNSAGLLKSLSFVNGVVGNAIGSDGTLAVTTQRAAIASTGQLDIGAGGTGLLSVTARGTASLSGLTLGKSAGSVGTATVAGVSPFASELDYGGAGRSLIVGDAGTGSITLSTLGVLVGSGADRVVLGKQATGSGTVTLSGPGTSWTNSSGDFVIGESGSGTLNISGGATLTTDTSNQIVLARNPGSSATVTIGAGSSWTESTQSVNLAAVGGGTATLNIAAGAVLDVPGLSVNPHGSLRGSGMVTTPGTVLNAGVVAPEGATAGTVGTLTVQGGGQYRQVSPNPQGAVSGELHLKVGGVTPGVDADLLAVSGNASLGGGFFLDLINGYDPPSGGGFNPQLIAATTRTGRFDVALFPGLSGNRYFKLNYGARDGSVTVGTGTITSPITYGSSVTAPTDVPSAEAVGDLNNDGLPDLVLAIPGNPALPGTVVVLFNGGTVGGVWQGYTSQITLAAGIGRNPRGIAVGNLDGVDGSGGTNRALDIAVSNFGDDTVSVITNTGGGTVGSFTALAPLAAGPEPLGIAVKRIMPGAGLDDIAVANSGPGRTGQNTVYLYKNQGGLVFASDPVPVGPQPTSVDPQDVDRDGRVDLIVVNRGTGTGTGTAMLRMNNGGNPPTWTGPSFAVGEQPMRVMGVDLNNDSFPEIVAVNAGDGTLSVLVNTGAGTFAPQVALPVGAVSGGAGSMTALDMDQDGDKDLVVIADQQVKVLRNDLNAGQIAFAPGAAPAAGVGIPILVDHGDVDIDNRDDLITLRTGPADTGGIADVRPNRSAGVCYANCDSSTQPPVLNVADFTCFLQKYANGDPYANCDASTQPPVLNVADFTCFLQKYANGCP